MGKLWEPFEGFRGVITYRSRFFGAPIIGTPYIVKGGEICVFTIVLSMPSQKGGAFSCKLDYFELVWRLLAIGDLCLA